MPSGNNGGLPLDLEPLIEHQRSVSTRSFGKPGLARLRQSLVPLALATAALLPVICMFHRVPHPWSRLNQQKPGALWRQGALFATATNTGASVPGECLDDQPLNDFSSAMAMSKAGWKLNWTAPSAFKPAKALYGVGVSDRSYWGYSSLGAGAMNLELRGNGNLTLDFGNSWIAFGSSVIAYLDGKEIARVRARNLSVVVTVPFQNRSVVQIVHQMNSVIVVNDVKIVCQNLHVDATSTSLVDAKADSASKSPMSTSSTSTTSPAMILNPAMPADDCGDPCRPPDMADAASISASLTDDKLHSGTIEIVTVETRNGNTSFPVPGVQGAYFNNLGASATWHGFITKVQLYHDFVKQQVAASSSKLLILADGSDLAFGGCSKEELLLRYQQTVAASGGAEVICGADSAIWPKHTKWHSEGPEINDTWRYGRFQGRMTDMLKALGMEGESNPYSAYMWRGPPQYVNSGFLMGPASVLLKILDCMLRRGGKGRDFDDQLALAECMFHRPESVAIDYGGSLVLTLQGFHKKVAMGHGGIFLNRVIAKAQCFLHFNAFEDENIKEWLQTWTAEAKMALAAPSAGANAIDDRYRYDDRVGHWGGTCTCPGSGRVYEVGDNNNKCLTLACDGGIASPCGEQPGDWTGTGMRVTCG